MGTNPIIFFVAALLPLVMGFLWYHPKLFGTAWMNGLGIAREVVEKGPKPVVFVVSYVLSLLLAYALYQITVHQTGLFSLVATWDEFAKEGSATHQQVTAVMELLKERHRSFGHGAFHGAVAGLFIAMPLIATNGMFERRSWKFMAINVGYWVVTVTLMGGLVCQFA